MNKIYILISILLMNIFLISALCEEGQIDINNAQKEELIQIIYIGEVRAEELILLRPFASLDELIKIKGIGEIYLSKIKEQGLACVNREAEEIVQDNENSEENITEEETEEQETLIEKSKNTYKALIQSDVIKLNTQNIKSEDNKEKLNKNEYAKYAFIGFCILLGLLLVLKKRKLNKNEFD